MNKEFIKKIKNLLEQEKKNLTIHTEAEVDCDGDETDEIQASMLIDITKNLSARSLNKLNAINDAFKRIESGDYNICDDCSDEIPEGRLLANPYVKICVNCAESRELEIKRKR